LRSALAAKQIWVAVIFYVKYFRGKNSAKNIRAATTNGDKKLVEFSVLIAQYLKFYYVILIISLPLNK